MYKFFGSDIIELFSHKFLIFRTYNKNIILNQILFKLTCLCFNDTSNIPEMRDISYEERLTECGLTTLETRRLRGDQIEVFKILNGYENIHRNMFFSLKKDSRTRGHEVKLVKDQCRLDIRKYSFSQRTVNEWNKLSTDCITASSMNMFKNKLYTYLRRAGYT